MSLSKPQVREYRQLKDSGVDVEDTNRVRYNEGSETSRHICAKSLAGLVAIRNGYRIDSEVPVANDKTDDGEIDTLIWGHDSRLTYAVELEHSPTEQVKAEKLEKYVRYTAVADLQLLNLNKCPHDMTDALDWIADELGLPS